IRGTAAAYRRQRPGLHRALGLLPQGGRRRHREAREGDLEHRQEIRAVAQALPPGRACPIPLLLGGAAPLAPRGRGRGRALPSDYEGKEPLLVGILIGAFVFLSDLLRSISIPCQVDFMATSSYGDAPESSGIVRILKDLDQSIEGRHVLIVDDI